eukprot:c13028_g7_i1.p1 GENE.c13028_g7_i1~~c13028_g7_i1.p1  ORF type:complete len:686 (-),score=123.90 c13028_g7_i1:149-1981(-)
MWLFDPRDLECETCLRMARVAMMIEPTNDVDCLQDLVWPDKICDIVQQRLLLEKEYLSQFVSSPHTSPPSQRLLALWTSQLFNQSPQRIDHLIDQIRSTCLGQAARLLEHAGRHYVRIRDFVDAHIDKSFSSDFGSQPPPSAEAVACGLVSCCSSDGMFVPDRRETLQRIDTKIVPEAQVVAVEETNKEMVCAIRKGMLKIDVIETFENRPEGRELEGPEDENLVITKHHRLDILGPNDINPEAPLKRLKRILQGFFGRAFSGETCSTGMGNTVSQILSRITNYAEQSSPLEDSPPFHLTDPNYLFPEQVDTTCLACDSQTFSEFKPQSNKLGMLANILLQPARVQSRKSISEIFSKYLQDYSKNNPTLVPVSFFEIMYSDFSNSWCEDFPELYAGDDPFGLHLTSDVTQHNLDQAAEDSEPSDPCLYDGTNCWAPSHVVKTLYQVLTGKTTNRYDAAMLMEGSSSPKYPKGTTRPPNMTPFMPATLTIHLTKVGTSLTISSRFSVLLPLLPSAATELNQFLVREKVRDAHQRMFWYIPVEVELSVTSDRSESGWQAFTPPRKFAMHQYFPRILSGDTIPCLIFQLSLRKNPNAKEFNAPTQCLPKTVTV